MSVRQNCILAWAIGAGIAFGVDLHWPGAAMALLLVALSFAIGAIYRSAK